MSYLLIMNWTHTSLAMPPEQSATSGENSSLRALEEHVPLITQKLQCDGTYTVPVAGQTQTAALLDWQTVTPHAKSQDPLQLCSAHQEICLPKLPERW